MTDGKARYVVVSADGVEAFHWGGVPPDDAEILDEPAFEARMAKAIKAADRKRAASLKAAAKAAQAD